MLTNESQILLSAIQQAGDAIALLQKQGFTTTLKANNDPLTEADLLANHILKQQLLGSFPQDGWLSEETADDATRLNCKRVWVVDPIDGTKEFVKGIPEFAVSVALVEDGVPILAAVLNPMTHELFHASRGQGAYLNGSPIHCDLPYTGMLTILASRTEMANGDWDSFSKDNDIRVVGSIAYKLALVAAGKAHATFSLGPKNEWDIAAGTLLVQEAGGVVTDKHKKLIKFNQPVTLVNSIIATSLATHERIHQLSSHI